MLSINSISQTKLNNPQNINFGSNSFRTLSKTFAQPQEDFFGIRFLQAQNDKMSYTSVQDFTQNEAGKIVKSLTNLRNNVREMLKCYGPEQFNLWLRGIIKNDDLECEIKCLPIDDKKSKICLSRFQNRGEIDLYDRRVSEEMRNSLYDKVRNKELPQDIKMDNGETWTVGPDFDGNFPGLDIYDSLKFSKKS